MEKYQMIIISISLPILVGIAGSFFTVNSINDWYYNLKKPEFSPPNWIFTPVWIFLYILMGLSFYYIWGSGYRNETKNAFHIYFIQLFLNFTWSFMFFGLKNPFLGLINIIILWFAIFINIILFYRLSKVSAYLLIPYLLWVSFASVLNYFVFIMN